MSKTVETCTAIITTTSDDEKQIVVVPKRKHGGGLNLLRVALYMIRGKSNGSKKKPVPAAAVEEVAPKGMLNKVVGSMRPLHLQHNNASPKLTISALPDSPIVGDYKDVFPPPMSPNGPFATLSPSSSEDGMSSRYASAVNLQELDKSEDNNGQAAGVVVKQEDEMIDAKADEFIARFYEQMRLQRLDSINLRYSEMNARALGWGA